MAINNPLNIKLGAATQKWVEQGLATIGNPALDGGRFLQFVTPQAAYAASKDLLLGPGYKNLTVDQAMRKWSGGGYGANVFQGIDPNLKMAELNDQQTQGLLQAMQNREAGVKKPLFNQTSLTPNQPQTINPGTLKFVPGKPQDWLSTLGDDIQNAISYIFPAFKTVREDLSTPQGMQQNTLVAQGNSLIRKKYSGTQLTDAEQNILDQSMSYQMGKLMNTAMGFIQPESGFGGAGPTKALSEEAAGILNELVPNLEKYVSENPDIREAQYILNQYKNILETGLIHPDLEKSIMEFGSGKLPGYVGPDTTTATPQGPKLIPSGEIPTEPGSSEVTTQTPKEGTSTTPIKETPIQATPIPKELQPLAEKTIGVSKEEFSTQFQSGLQSKNITIRDTTNNIQKSMQQAGFKTPEEFYAAANSQSQDGRIISDALSKNSGNDQLSSEALKYKSAEDFVKAQGGGKYPTIHEGGVVKMVDGEPVKIVDGVETLLHKGDGGWIVSEASTGRFISESRSKDGAIAKASFKIDEVGKDKLIDAIKKNKIASPIKNTSQLTEIWNKAHGKTTSFSGDSQVEKDIFKKFGLSDLSPELQKIQKDNIKFVAKNSDKLIKEYVNKNGYFLNGDLIKETLFPEYRKDRTNIVAFNAGGNYLWEKLFEKFMADGKTRGDGSVVVITGGQGSGKTTTLEKAFDKDWQKKASFSMESILNDATRNRILNAGYILNEWQVVAGMDTSFERMVKRAQAENSGHIGKGRPVTIDGFINAHQRARLNGLKWSKSDNPNYVLHVIDNTGDHFVMAPQGGEVDVIKKEGYTGGSEEKKQIEKKYYENVQQKLQNKEISQSVFDGITRAQGNRPNGQEGGGADGGNSERQPQTQKANLLKKEDNQKFLKDIKQQIVKETQKANPENIVQQATVGKNIPPKQVIAKNTGLNPDERMITKSESQMLRDLLRREARGSKSGFREGAKQRRLSILKKLAEQNDTVESIKNSIIEYANSSLNPETRGKLLVTIRDAKTFNDLAKATDMIQRIGERSDHSRLIKAIKKELKESFYTGSGDKRVSKYSPNVTRMLESFKDNLSGKSLREFTVQKMEFLTDWIENHPNEEPPSYILDQLDEFQRTHLSLLTNNELREQLASIRALKEQGKTFKQLTVERIKFDRSKTILEFNKIILGPNELKKSYITPRASAMNRAISKAKEFLEKNLIPDVLFDILDEKSKAALYSGPIHSKFINLISAGRDAEISGTNKTLGEIQQFMKDKNVFDKLGEIVDFGDGIKLTRNQMLDVYIKSHDKAIMASMMEGGITTPDGLRVIGKMTDEKIKQVISALSPEEKEVGDYILNKYDQGYESINQVFRKVHFFDMPKNKGYSPMTKDMNYVGEEEINLVRQQLEYAKASVPKGFTKARTGSLAPVRLGAVENLVDHVVRSEHYKAFELASREMSSILSGIKEAVTQEHGVEYYKVLRDFIKQIANNGKIETSYLSRVLLTARRNLTVGYLGLNPITSLKHMISSLGGAMTELSTKDFLSGLYQYYSDKQKWNDFWDKVPQIAERAKSMTRSMKEVHGGKLPEFLNKTNWREKQMALLRLGDKNIVRAEATAVYQSFKKQGMSDAQAIERAVSKMRRTQTSGDITSMSALQSGGPFEKMFTMFMSEKSKYFNLLYSNMRAYRTGRISKASLAKTIFWSWIFIGMAMEEIRRGGTANMQQLTTAAILSPIEDILILGNLVTAVRESLTSPNTTSGFGFSFDPIPAVSLASQMASEFITVSKAKTESAIQNGLLSLAESAATASGFGVTPVVRATTSIANILQGKTNDWRTLLWTTSELNQKTKKTTTTPKGPWSQFGGKTQDWSQFSKTSQDWSQFK